MRLACPKWKCQIYDDVSQAIQDGPFGDSSIDSYKIGDSDRRGTMPRRFITHLFLFVWLTLLGVEFAEQVGWFVFPDQAVDDSVDEAVVSLGVALKTAAPEVATAASVVFIDVLAVRLLAVMLEYAGDLVLSPEPTILGPPLPMCKLHCTFLI